MATKVSIDPITRIEGHLTIKVEVESNVVVSALSSGEMFRGFETILKGRHPMDAQHITQRICGVCPISHGKASVLAQDMAYGIKTPLNGRIARNLILATNYIQSHILHFYHLSALDFVDITAITSYTGKDQELLELKAWVKAQMDSGQLYPAAPFLPRYDAKYIENAELNIIAIKHYLDALSIRALAHKACAIFAGKIPHAATLVPGGVTETITVNKIATYRSIIKTLRQFVDDVYVPDVLAVAEVFPDYFKLGKGCGNFLSYGVFSESDNNAEKFFPSGVLINNTILPFDPTKISEDILYAKYESQSHLHPSQGQTTPSPKKKDAYSWLKAPRYDSNVVEVGPLARVLISYLKKKHEKLNTIVDSVCQKFNITTADLVSALGRHAARAIEAKIVAEQCCEWVEQLNPEQPSFIDFSIPEQAQGFGLTEAPRGALGHWIDIRGGKIANYQCVVPTTWNCSPKDDKGIAGPVEQALIGTPVSDTSNPIEPARVVRSFDPCIACAVH